MFYGQGEKIVYALGCLLLMASWSFAQEYSEAPQLAEAVAAGTLRPVEERLPANPVVVPVIERIGDYGGTWRTALRGGDDTVWLERTIGNENLVRWELDWSDVTPNVAETFEVNEDATVFTFNLREGLKWSDGHPFTADDILFWYEDVLLNDELTPSFPSWLRSGGEPVAVAKLDDFTITFNFTSPNGLFLQRMATGAGADITNHPRHYLEQFHTTYNAENIDALVQDFGLDDWSALFDNRRDRWGNSELPTLFGWVVTNPYGQGTQVVAERNPYYFKVDPEGNQLPYLDRVVYEQVESVDVLVLRAAAGELDMQDRHINSLTNRPVLFDNQERGNYRFFTVVPDIMNTSTLFLNLTHPDPIKREIFNNKDFRIGLSHAINRDEINDLVYIGQGEPWQAAPRPESRFYHERLAKQYTEYDVELANEYLDRAGFSERDSSGYRLGPDGNRISFTIEASQAIWPELTDAIEMVETYWQAVGIDAQLRVMDRALMWERKTSNEHDVWVWAGGGGLDNILNPGWYMSVFAGGATIGRTWEIWENNHDHPLAEEPPAGPKLQIALYHELLETADPSRQDELFREILEIAADEFYLIGINLMPEGFGIVKNDFRNVPEEMFDAVTLLNPGYTNPSQYFIEGGGR